MKKIFALILATLLGVAGVVAGFALPANATPAKSYVTVAWQMPSYAGANTATWPQTLATSRKTAAPDLNVLDSQFKCGIAYQVDIYNDSKITDKLIDGGNLYGSNNPQEDLIAGGWGTAYKIAYTPCVASAGAIIITAATCDADGSAALGTVVNAKLDGDLDQTAGTHTATFTANPGSEFEGSGATFSEDYTVPAKLTGQQCVVKPEQPKPIVTTETSTFTDCDAKLDTTTVTTTTVNYVYDADSNTWVKDKPVVMTTQSTKPATEQECPTKVVTPPTKPTNPTPKPTVTPKKVVAPAPAPSQSATPVKATLADTGSDNTPSLVLAALILLAGIGVLVGMRVGTRVRR